MKLLNGTEMMLWNEFEMKPLNGKQAVLKENRMIGQLLHFPQHMRHNHQLGGTALEVRVVFLVGVVYHRVYLHRNGGQVSHLTVYTALENTLKMLQFSNFPFLKHAHPLPYANFC